MAISSIPSLRTLSTEEQIQKIHKYLMTLKNDLEYELANIDSSGKASVDIDTSGIFEILGFTKEDIDFWNNIKNITDNIGNVIGEKISGMIDLAKTLIMSTTAHIQFDEHGIYITDKLTDEESTWAMRIGAVGFMIADGKIISEDNESWEWDWETFGTGKGFNAKCITTGELYAITLNACDIIAGNMTSGNITGVNMRACNLEAVNLKSSKIESTDIESCCITSAIFIGGLFEGDEANILEINAGTINASTFNTGTLNMSTFTAGFIETSKLEACEINAAIITGSIVQSLGENGEGVCLQDQGYGVYAPTSDKKGVLAGLMMFDQNGAGTAEEAANRVFFGTENGYALKVYSDGNMSLSARGKIYLDDCVFMGTTNLAGNISLRNKIEWKDDGCIIDDKYYLQMTDTSITFLNTGKVMSVTTSSGTVAEAYAAQ